MVTLIKKLAPGALATLAAFAVGAASLAYAQSKTDAAAPVGRIETPSLAPYAPAAPSYTVCGACGEQIGTPRPVFVAEPVNAPQRRAVRDGRGFAAPVRQGYDDCAPREVVVYYVGGVPDRPAFPRTSYDLPAVQCEPAGYPHTVALSHPQHRAHGHR